MTIYEQRYYESVASIARMMFERPSWKSELLARAACAALPLVVKPGTPVTDDVARLAAEGAAKYARALLEELQK